jgi:hypothetical protein
MLPAPPRLPTEQSRGPSDAAIAPNIDGLVVRTGAVLATRGAGEIRAPRDGQVIAVDADASGRPHRLVLRAAAG